MTALPSKAHIKRGAGHVRLVPKADICSAANSDLLDHRVGTCQHDWRQVETDRFRGLEIDHQLKLGRLLDRQVGRFGAIEDLTIYPAARRNRLEKSVP